MLSLDDPRWRDLEGGYAVSFDVSIPLRRLEAGEDVWKELWDELHHQGDVGAASYAAVPQLVRIGRTLAQRDWNFYGLVSTIEIERHRKSNPPMPTWLAKDYETAFADLLKLALGDLHTVQDQETTRSILGAIALAKGDVKLGALIAHSDDSEIDEILDERDSWSNLYN